MRKRPGETLKKIPVLKWLSQQLQTHVTSKLDVPCKIYVPNYVSKAKLNTMKLMGADTELHGDDCVDAEIKARSVAEVKHN